jgi:hypothetical protein
MFDGFPGRQFFQFQLLDLRPSESSTFPDRTSTIALSYKTRTITISVQIDMYFFFWREGRSRYPEDATGFETEQVGLAGLIEPGDQGGYPEGSDASVEGIGLTELAHSIGEFLKRKRG